MTITVVITALNEAARIGDHLDRMKRQGADEIIVVDDGSADNTAEIAREKGATVLRFDKNCGVPAAINHGLSFVKTSHVLFNGVGDTYREGLLGKIRATGTSATVTALAKFHRGDGLSRIGGTPHWGYLSARECAEFPDLQIMSHTTAFAVRHNPIHPEALQHHSDWYACQLVALKHGMFFLPIVGADVPVDPKGYSGSRMGDRKLMGKIVRRLVAFSCLFNREAGAREVWDLNGTLGDFGWAAVGNVPGWWRWRCVRRILRREAGRFAWKHLPKWMIP